MSLMNMSLNKLAAIGATLVVVATVTAGLLLSGSPAEERDRRLDAQRVAALQHLASVVSVYHETSGMLPPTLAALVDGRNLQEVPRDPVSGQPYGYDPDTDGNYALCADFDARSEAGEVPQFWMHEAGRYCFRLSPAYGQY